MATNQLHPTSALVGASLALASTTLAALTALGSGYRVAVVNPVAVQGIPSGTDYIRIVEASPYTVPAGKRLVLTAFGATHDAPSLLDLLVDGVIEARGAGPAAGGFITDLPEGFAVDTGSTVSLDQLGGTAAGVGRAWGYIVDIP